MSTKKAAKGSAPARRGTPVPKGVAALLGHDDEEVRVAAAVVLREQGPADAATAGALVGLLAEGSGLLEQRATLRALAKLGLANGALDRVLPFLGARDDGVRAAAIEAAVSAGQAALKPLRAKLDAVPLGAAGALKGTPAPGAVEKRAIETVLSRLGGKEALGALLAGIVDDPASARTVTHELRAQVKDADGHARRSIRTQLEAFLGEHAKPDAKTDPARAAAIKVLGYLEDERTVPMLVKLAKNPKERGEVRQDAIIALRFAASGAKADASVVDALQAAARADESSLSQAALLTLGSLPMTKKLAGVFQELAGHPDIARAHLAIRRLASDDGADGAAALASLVAGRDEQRAQLATDALLERRKEGRDDGTDALLAQLAECDDARGASRIRNLLRPVAGAWSTATKKKLLASADRALDAGRVGWREAYDLAASADGKTTAKHLREVIAAARKSRKRDRERELLGLLLRIDPTPEDRYRLALFLLGDSKLDTNRAARRSDEALKILDQLARQDFDVAGALRKEKNVSLEQLYYLGFCFAEEGDDLGSDLLKLVIAQAGRKKIATAAKNKLKLMGD
ncbi:MAG: HEAT repeat domain-containing protein [Polyangiales bacterium]